MTDQDLAVPAPAQSKPLWKRIVEFPLVALLLGMLAFAALIFVIGLSYMGLAEATGSDIKSAPEWLETFVPAVLLTIGSVVVLKLVLRRLGEKQQDDLPFDARAGDFFVGILFAALLMSTIVAIAALLGGYRIEGWGGSTSFLMLIVVTGFQAAFFEEILFRGLIFRFLEDFFGSWIALLLSALAFGLVHWSNPNGTLFAGLAIALEAGILLGAAYMFTRNLWLAIGIHWGWNVVQGYVWDVSVSGIAVDGLVDAKPVGDVLISGGAFGLEASVIAMVLATASGLWLLKKAHDLGHIVSPWWVRRRKGVALPASTPPLSPTLALRT